MGGIERAVVFLGPIAHGGLRRRERHLLIDDPASPRHLVAGQHARAPARSSNRPAGLPPVDFSSWSLIVPRSVPFRLASMIGCDALSKCLVTVRSKKNDPSAPVPQPAVPPWPFEEPHEKPWSLDQVLEAVEVAVAGHVRDRQERRAMRLRPRIRELRTIAVRESDDAGLADRTLGARLTRCARKPLGALCVPRLERLPRLAHRCRPGGDEFHRAIRC